MLELELELQCPRIPRAARWDRSQTTRGGSHLIFQSCTPSFPTDFFSTGNPAKDFKPLLYRFEWENPSPN